MPSSKFLKNRRQRLTFCWFPIVLQGFWEPSFPDASAGCWAPWPAIPSCKSSVAMESPEIWLPFSSTEPEADPEPPFCWEMPSSGCGGTEAFGQVLGQVPDDPRDLVALILKEGESFDRQTVQRTLKVIGDGLWAFRGDTLESRERAANRTLMLSHLARHLERFGSADLVIEAAAMVLRSENPRDVVARIPRVMGTHWA